MTRLDPDGFRELTKYLYDRYKKPIFCTESGFAVMSENSLPLLDALDDRDRVEYYKGVLEAMLDAVHEDGVIMKAYFPWSTRLLQNSIKRWISDTSVNSTLGFLDNFEWADGYETRFGVTYVDYATQARYPKSSAIFLRKWFAEYIETARPVSKAECDSTGVPTSCGSSLSSANTNVALDTTPTNKARDILSIHLNVTTVPELVADSWRTKPNVQPSVSSPAHSPLSDPDSLLRTPLDEGDDQQPGPLPADANSGSRTPSPMHDHAQQQVVLEKEAPGKNPSHGVETAQTKRATA